MHPNNPALLLCTVLITYGLPKNTAKSICFYALLEMVMVNPEEVLGSIRQH